MLSSAYLIEILSFLYLWIYLRMMLMQIKYQKRCMSFPTRRKVAIYIMDQIKAI